MRIAILIVLSNFYCFLFSQTSGLVLDENQYPISEVDVYISDLNLLIQTDLNGEFYFDSYIIDNTYVQFSKYGYSSKVVKYQNNENFTIILRQLHVKLDEIGIKESSSILGNNKTINIENKLLKNNFVSSTSLVESISRLPGVQMISSGLGIQKVVVRGLSGLRVVTFLNGMRISNQEWANDHGIGFTDLGLNDVELIKGAASLKFGGEAIGGVLYFKDSPFVKSTIPSGFIASKFDNSHVLFSNQFGMNWSKKSFFLNAYGQHSASADYRLPDNTYLFNSRLNNQSFKLAMGILSNDIQTIFRYQYNADNLGIPAHVHGGDLTSISIDNLTSDFLILSEDFKMTRPTQFINNHLFTYETKYRLNNINYSFFAGHFINNLQEYDKWTVPAFDMDLSTSTFRFNLDIPFSYIDINTGIQHQIQSNFNNITDRLIPDANTNESGVYFIVNYDKKKLGFNSGLRLDYKKIMCSEYSFNKSFLSFNTSHGLFYKLNNNVLRMTYSSSFRAPHLSELFSYGLHHGTMRFEIGDVNLQVEKSHQFDLKYQWNDDHFGFVVNPFTQIINNFISISPTDGFYNSIYRIYNYTQFNNVQISGCELNVHYHPHFIHNLHIEQSYSFINAQNKDNDSYISRTPSNKIKTTLNLDLSQYNILLNIKSFTIYHLYSFAQNNISLFEESTNSYNVLNMDLFLEPFKRTTLVIGANNILNEEYVPHISRVRDVAGGVPNPGRSFHISLKYDF
tara:strand:+ start:3414 stop:5624 length:2211 start_codon:yes stop_codon:yes gene_type:complete